MNNAFVIFGATGDLTHRKLMPAFYNLAHEGNIPENFAIVAVGRRDYDTEKYARLVIESIARHSRFSLKEDICVRLKERIRYFRFNFLHDDYCRLAEYLREIDAEAQTGGNRIYYLAVAPEHFATIVANLEKKCLRTNGGYSRCMIEKPFGSDLRTAKELNDQITAVFSEKNIFRIDHYLGKEMFQNIMAIRFANAIFEPLLNRDHVEQVQILSAETRGVGARGHYYDNAGEIRDMIQSHLLQLISLIAMERPAEFSDQEIRDEKVKVLRALRRYSPDEVARYVVRGQYGVGDDALAYRDEVNVDKNSPTETFVAMKLFIENDRWRGVPFYLRSGKRMPVKATEIIIEFKNAAYRGINAKNNILVIKIQPEEGVYLRFNAKEIGARHNIIPVKMDFCQNCEIGFNSPEAYEKLLLDAMRGEATLFARWDEVEAAWEFVDTIREAWKNDAPPFPNYRPGAWGPAEAERIVAADGKKWLVLQGGENEDL